MKTIITENLQNTQRYIPHTLETRLAAVKTYRNKNSISFICRRYKVSKASLIKNMMELKCLTLILYHI